jgi:hypothetical protein
MLSLLLALAPLPAQDAWVPLPLPEPCREAPDGGGPRAAEGGRHLVLEEPTEFGRRGARSALPPEALVGLLEQAAAAAGHRPEFFPYAPPLQARGDDAALAWTRRAVRAIDEAGRRNRVRLSASLTSRGPDGSQPGATRSWAAEARAGETITFGERERRSFVASYQVEVSTDSGVARPVVGHALLGHALELTAARVDGGRRYHLRGRLDLAALEAVEPFDAGTPDLGALDQPRVRALTLDFSGVAASGEPLEVRLEGTPLEAPDWVLTVRVETSPELPGPSPEGTPPGADWRAIDVSLLEGRSPVLPALDPGAGLTGEARLATVTPASAAVTAAGVLGLARADGGRPGAPRGAAPAQAAEGLVLVAASADPGGLAERVADLVRSLEAPRLATRTVLVRQGALRATFPVAEGETARLFVGTERSLLIGYRTEIAPNTWMPVPQVEVALDGLALQGRLSSGGLDVEAWSSETLEVRRQERRDAKVGALQLPERRVRAARARVEDGAGELLAADGERPALGVSVREP